MNGECRVYRAPSGQWSWVIFEDGEDVVRGAGYETEDEAFKDMCAEKLIRWMMAGSPAEDAEQ